MWERGEAWRVTALTYAEKRTATHVTERERKRRREKRGREREERRGGGGRFGGGGGGVGERRRAEKNMLDSRRWLLKGWWRGSREEEEAIEQLSRDDGSHTGVSSGILPSLGARSNRRVKLRRFIVSPFDARYGYFLSEIYIYILWDILKIHEF